MPAAPCLAKRKEDLVICHATWKMSPVRLDLGGNRGGWEQDSKIQAWHVTVSSSWREASQPVVVQVAAKYTVVVLSGREVLWFVGVEGSAWYCLALHGCPVIGQLASHRISLVCVCFGNKISLLLWKGPLLATSHIFPSQFPPTQPPHQTQPYYL